MTVIQYSFVIVVEKNVKVGANSHEPKRMGKGVDKKDIFVPVKHTLVVHGSVRLDWGEIPVPYLVRVLMLCGIRDL